MARLRLTLLGPFRVQLASGDPVELPGKPAALLSYLALRPGRAHARDALAALLWGESGDEHARHSLRQALTVLRQRLIGEPRPPLLVDGETVALDPASVDIDVVAFERLVASGDLADLEGATVLYQGDFLEGLRSTEGPFEEEGKGRSGARGMGRVSLTLFGPFRTRLASGDPVELPGKPAARLAYLGMRPLIARGHLGLGRLCRRRRERDQALEHLATATAMLAEMGMRYWRAEAESELVRARAAGAGT